MEKLLSGELRVPAFQRRFKWEPKDALLLLDSVVRGYPVGTLLLWHLPAPASTLHYGTITVEAPASSDALWVVDGQQRLLSLGRVLLGSGAPDEPFALFFDLEGESFMRPPRGTVPPHWLPMEQVLDEERLHEWTFSRREALSEELRKRAFRLGKIIRQFEIPGYAVRIDDEAAVREIYRRANDAGRHMEVHEVFDALHGARGDARPSRMSEIADTIAELGFGKLEEERLFKMMLAILGRDVGSKEFPRLAREQAEHTYKVLERAARAAVAFLRDEAGIPHVDLLPYEKPLVVLATFFHRFSRPSARSRELLARWVWRGALTKQHSGEITSTRRALAALDRGEDDSVQELLGQIDRTPPEQYPGSSESFNKAAGKLFTLAMLDRGPLHIETGEAIRLAGDIYADYIQDIFLDPPEPCGNRMIHPKIGRLARALAEVSSESILASHGIDRETHERLRRGDRSGFLLSRARLLEDGARAFFERRARWDEPDDPPISALLIEEDD